MIQILQSIPLFAHLAAPELDRLTELVREESFSAGQTIFRGGDPADALYVVVQGQVAILQEAVGQPLNRYAELGSGEWFGEMGLLNDSRRFASARAASDTRLLKLDKAAFLQLLDEQPLIELKVRTEAIRRHRANVAAALELGQRREVRIRVARPVMLSFANGSKLHLVLDNLSAGGGCLQRVPPQWRVGQVLSFDLGGAKHPGLLTVEAKVVWRRGEAAGLAFLNVTSAQVQAVLRRLLGR